MVNKVVVQSHEVSKETEELIKEMERQEDAVCVIMICLNQFQSPWGLATETSENIITAVKEVLKK